MVKIAKLNIKYKSIYRSLEPTWCPAVKDWVAFNNQGWKHFRYRGDGSRRIIAELSSRLKLIPFIPEIVAGAQSYEIKKMGNTCYYSLQSGTVRVILRKVGNGKLHYYSIFSTRKTKKPSKWKLFCYACFFGLGFNHGRVQGFPLTSTLGFYNSRCTMSRLMCIISQWFCQTLKLLPKERRSES